MSQAELIAALGPGRLPPGWELLGWREVLALIGAGLLLGGAIAILTRPLMMRRPSLRDRIRATRGLPPQERLLAIARILGRLPDALRGAAYGAKPPPDDGTIERIAGRKGRR